MLKNLSLSAVLVACLLSVSGNALAQERIGQKQAEVVKPAALVKPAVAAKSKSLAEIIADANRGEVMAQLLLAKKYTQGEGVRQDHPEAVKWLRKAADVGDPKAQTMLGAAYTRGMGVGVDDRVAQNWYLLASMQDYADANFMLGMRYIAGAEGRLPIPDKGVELLKRAADQGLADAQVNLGIYYLQGKVVPKDFAMALKLFKTAASDGSSAAFAVLGVMHESGLGVKQSNTAAWMWTSLSLQAKPDSNQEKSTLASLEKAMTLVERKDAVELAMKCVKSEFKDCE